MRCFSVLLVGITLGLAALPHAVSAQSAGVDPRAGYLVDLLPAGELARRCRRTRFRLRTAARL
jgi:hypothetical protein